MSEQEININVPSTPHNIQSDKDSKAKVIDLTQEASAAKTSEELIDVILNKSPEELLVWEKVTLPSQGLFYEGRIPGGELMVRPMGLITDKILATSRLTQSGQAMDHVFKYCCKFPDKNFDPLDLLAGDRMFLLYYLRGIKHGNNYEFSVTCANEQCKVVSTHEYNLNKLGSTIRVPKVTSEPIRILLPYFSKMLGKDIWVEARFLRGRDIQVMIRQQKIKGRMKSSEARNAKTGESMAEDNSIDATIEENLNLLITSVNGVKDRIKIQQFISRLHAKDTATIRESLKENQPGIDTEIIIDCPNCKQEMRIELPITESFFRPTESRVS